MGFGVYGWQYEELPCPFCDTGRVNAKYYPSSVSVKRSATASLPVKSSQHKSKETWLIQSGCSKCGKSSEEVEKELQRKNII